MTRSLSSSSSFIFVIDSNRSLTYVDRCTLYRRWWLSLAMDAMNRNTMSRCANLVVYNLTNAFDIPVCITFG
jgi:hypothetical protein